MDHAELIKRLYLARKKKAQAKAAHQAVCTTWGPCNDTFPEPRGPRCFEMDLDETEYCDGCKAKLPYWKAWRRASTEAATALRAVLTEGKRLAEDGGAAC